MFIGENLRDDRNKGTEPTVVKGQQRQIEWERDIVVYRSRVELAVDVSRWILSFASMIQVTMIYVYIYICMLNILSCICNNIFYKRELYRVSSEQCYILRKSYRILRAQWTGFFFLSCLAAFQELEIVQRQRSSLPSFDCVIEIRWYDSSMRRRARLFHSDMYLYVYVNIQIFFTLVFYNAAPLILFSHVVLYKYSLKKCIFRFLLFFRFDFFFIFLVDINLKWYCKFHYKFWIISVWIH